MAAVEPLEGGDFSELMDYLGRKDPRVPRAMAETAETVQMGMQVPLKGAPVVLVVQQVAAEEEQVIQEIQEKILSRLLTMDL